jgi:hypothetical protein
MSHVILILYNMFFGLAILPLASIRIGAVWVVQDALAMSVAIIELAIVYTAV